MLTFLAFKPLVHKVDKVILVCNLLIMSLPDGGYSKNASFLFPYY